MKKKLIALGAALLTLLVLVFVALYIWIDIALQKNIKCAKEKYPGTAEDALIAYLLDTNNLPGDRSRIAIWTLGQIHSQKALPILKELYKNDPKGETCYRKHQYVLCQYELYKAIKLAESKGFLLHTRLNK